MTEETPNTYSNILQHKNVHRRLKIRLYLYVILSLVLIGMVIYHLFQDFKNEGSIILPLLGLIVGVSLGFLITRMYKISWDHGAEKVISTVDKTGVLIIVLYVVFEIFRDKVVGYFIQGPLVASTSFALLTGIMIGRVLGIRGKIHSVLEENL